jgi:hypothetical protein
MSTIVLVSCVSRKRQAPCVAADLYISPWFIKARRYAEATGDSWYILSAQYALVDPAVVIASYEQTLNAMTKAQREAWGARVRSALGERLSPGDRVILLAGERYRQFLEEPLRAEGYHVEVPLKGLGIGRQLQRLGQLAQAHAAPAGAARSPSRR